MKIGGYNSVSGINVVYIRKRPQIEEEPFIFTTANIMTPPITPITIRRNFTKIDWGDGTIDTVNNIHTYNTQGEKTIKVYGMDFEDKSLSDEGFMSGYKIKSFSFPQEQTFIPNFFFSQVDFVDDLTITIQDHITRLGAGAFNSDLYKLNLNHVRQIYDNCYLKTTSYLNLGDSLEYIGDNGIMGAIMVTMPETHSSNELIIKPANYFTVWDGTACSNILSTVKTINPHTCIYIYAPDGEIDLRHVETIATNGLLGLNPNSILLFNEENYNNYEENWYGDSNESNKLKDTVIVKIYKTDGTIEETTIGSLRA